jgi:hypothetical protein
MASEGLADGVVDGRAHLSGAAIRESVSDLASRCQQTKKWQSQFNQLFELTPISLAARFTSLPSLRIPGSVPRPERKPVSVQSFV